jgi:hypothetical protein
MKIESSRDAFFDRVSIICELRMGDRLHLTIDQSIKKIIRHHPIKAGPSIIPGTIM